MTVKIVYIDDEPMLCRAFSAVLGSVNIPVETFTDAAAALAHIEANDVAAVFCDYRMPAMTGLDVLERVRRDVPFFLVSGDTDVVASVATKAGVSGSCRSRTARPSFSRWCSGSSSARASSAAAQLFNGGETAESTARGAGACPAR